MPKRPARRRVKLDKAKTEPAVLRGVVVAVLTLLASLGVSWAADVDKETIAAIVTILGVLAPIAATLWTRFAVTPNSKVIARVSQSKDAIVTGDAAALRTGTVLATTGNLGGDAVQLNEPVVVSPRVLAPPTDRHPGFAP